MHYINAPRDATLIDMSRDCPNGDCVVGAINRFITEIQNPNLSEETRVDALKFLIHFIGDVHMPMHVSYSDDRGGTQVPVTFFGSQNWNLHSVWDTGIIRRRSGGDWISLAIQIRSDITPAEISTWQNSTDPVDWANESLTITGDIYANLPGDFILDQTYYDEYVDDIEEQLQAGGVRLAYILNTSFTSVPPLPDTGGNPFAALDGDALDSALYQYMIDGHQNFNYRTAREHLYWYVDNDNGTVVTIYDRRAIPLLPDEWPNSSVVNCEHTWPKSMGAGSRPAKTDIHHLRPAVPNINSTRGNMPFGTPIPPYVHDFDWKVGYEPDGDKVFMPPPEMRGDISRGMFYFSIRYRMPIDEDQEEDLRLWHEQDPVDAAELARMMRVYQRQGNKNPFVEYPSLVDRIDDF